MWGIIPAAGIGSRIQPLGFAKELLPLGSRLDGDTERPRAASEYLVDRMLKAGVDKICFVISPAKAEILKYYGDRVGGADICYVVQAKPAGLCDSIFRAAPLIQSGESVVVGLPDTVWFPDDALALLPESKLSFLLFPVDQPQHFDSVRLDEQDNVLEIQVKQPGARSKWIWGAFKMPGTVYHELHRLWQEPGRGDEYVGTLVNAYLARRGSAVGLRAGDEYVDIGTLGGYRAAMSLLAERAQPRTPAITGIGGFS